MTKEVFFNTHDVIVSKTNLKGWITYVNPIFCDVSGYTEEDLLNKPHSIIRHPKMPRCVFKLLWDTLATGSEIFAYVINECKNGDYYWVFAHVTPSLNEQGEIVAYHSNRRVPDPDVIKEKVIPLYESLLKIEESAPNRKEGMQAAFEHLVQLLQKSNITYDEFVFSLDTSMSNHA